MGQYIYGGDGKYIGKISPNSRGGFDVFDENGKYAGHSDQNGTFDGHGKLVARESVPGLLLSK